MRDIRFEMTTFPGDNLTFQILDRAAKGGYAVGAFCCYNDDGVIAVIQAAERCKSPAIIQLFPWSIHFQGAHFVQYVVSSAHTAKVPIAVHLDHCTESEDVEVALQLPFDSIMIDASLHDIKDSIHRCKDIVTKAKGIGITIEVEMGRINGDEDGVGSSNTSDVLTEVLKAQRFIEETGVHFFAPSFGNIHGRYPAPGPEGCWNLSLLSEVHKAIPHTPLVLHGTHGVSDDLFRTARAHGIVKININRTVRDEYTEFIAENAGILELTVLKSKGVEIYTKSIERVMFDVLGSAGKA